MFRKLYWVSEQVFPDQTSTVNGVYTSIPDLVKHGLRYAPGGNLRLTLTKLDSSCEPLGRWQSPRFEALSDDLQSFVETEEMTSDQVKLLADALAAGAQA